MSEPTNKFFSLSKPAIIVISIICVFAVVLGCVFGIKCNVSLEHFCPAPTEMRDPTENWSVYRGSIALNNSTKTIVNVTRLSRFTPYVPYRKGYTFNGWYKDMGLTIPFLNETTITHNITLYAKWTPQFLITFDYGKIKGYDIRPNETMTNTVYVDANTIYAPPTNYTAKMVMPNDNDTFTIYSLAIEGWYTDINRTIPWKQGIVSSDMTLYANWKTV